MSAWGTYYRLGVGYKLMPSVSDEAVMQYFAVRAIKAELAYRGYAGDPGPKLNLGSGRFGIAAQAQTKLFQDAMGLEVDGVVGPQTGRALFLTRMIVAEHVQNIPHNYIAKIASLESGFDPGAIGSADPRDHGLFQVNLHFHPDVTEEQSATPSFVVPWAAKQLAAAFGSLNDWEAAVASWNVGYVAARQWLFAGKPQDGSTAAQYVTLVSNQSV